MKLLLSYLKVFSGIWIMKTAIPNNYKYFQIVTFLLGCNHLDSISMFLSTSKCSCSTDDSILNDLFLKKKRYRQSQISASNLQNNLQHWWKLFHTLGVDGPRGSMFSTHCIKSGLQTVLEIWVQLDPLWPTWWRPKEKLSIVLQDSAIIGFVVSQLGS